MNKPIFLILIFFILIIIFTSFTEYYTDNPLLVYKTSMNNKKLWIKWDKKYESLWKNKCKAVENIEIVENSHKLYYDYTIVMDCYTYDKMRNKFDNKVLLILPDSMYLYFVKPRDNKNNERFTDIILNNRIIGYTSQYVRDLIIIIARSLHMNVGKIQLKKINESTNIDQSFYKNEKIDIVCCYNCLNNQFNPSFKIDFIDYSGLDINLLKYYIPYAKVNNVSLDVFFLQYKTLFPVKTLMSIDLLICGPESIEKDIILRDTIFSLLILADNFSVLNYYTIYFKFWSQTYNLLRYKNNYIKNRDTLNILEQFSFPSKKRYFELVINNNVEGYYQESLYSFTIKNTQINNIPLQIGWRIILNNQFSFSENGEYFVKNIDINKQETRMEKKLILQGNHYKIDINNNLILDSNLLGIDGVNIDNIKRTDIIYISNIDKWGHLHDKKITLFNLPPGGGNEISLDDTRWSCTDPTIKIKGLCESEYTIDGITKKPVPTFWDRRCEKNVECPFYQANKNYSNYYGGCDNGYCSMPVGVDRIAYRLYDKRTKPLCYGCVEEKIGDCCEEQKNKKLYPDLESPDLAFPLDQFQRLTSKWKL